MYTTCYLKYSFCVLNIPSTPIHMFRQVNNVYLKTELRHVVQLLYR
jgi:hypothetical protein